ncbi:MAG TPA: hypothetical protein VI318_14175 [Baekduia sp.]
MWILDGLLVTVVGAIAPRMTIAPLLTAEEAEAGAAPRPAHAGSAERRDRIGRRGARHREHDQPVAHAPAP